jgi:hypothetical protein
MKYGDEIQSSLHTKFPSEHLLGNADRVDTFLQWMTFFRRNLHRFAETYLNIKLYWYQAIVLYLMGRSATFCWVASRAAAKSFIIAIFTCSMCILYPGYQFVLCSGTRGQARLIVSAKILGELIRMSNSLANEIDMSKTKNTSQETIVWFKNGSSIVVVTSSDSARGYRAHGYCAEEFRTIDKTILDSVIIPFLVIRKPPYMMTARYADVPELQEEFKEVYISSAWLCDHWMWPFMKETAKNMFDGGSSTILGMDYAIVLKHRIKTRAQLTSAKQKADPITWALEYGNIMLKNSAGAYFPYALLSGRQVMKKAFYPRRQEDKKPKLQLPKLPDEIRIVAADIAMIDNDKNDQSVFTLIRCLPEALYDGEGESPRTTYRLQVPYLESRRGQETLIQATRIRQLFDSFEADFCVLDCRNAGAAIAGALGRVIYDEMFDVEYRPWSCINNDDIAKLMPSPNGLPVLYAFTGTSQVNSTMAVNMRTLFVDKRIDLLISHAEGIEELTSKIPEYAASNDPDEQLFWEKPYLETKALIYECANLQYEKLESTGAIKVKEKSTAMKDRYSSLAMGCYFASELEQDLGRYQDEEELSNSPIFVSKLNM